eukprot:GILI01005417.1.p1 GENE.GILI01005417.1~~GILI01005417.1.p1  ORF type:complete len:364 (-),score=137.12 GILI01005417.1:92-1156(-)
MSALEGCLLGMENPLLDISANVTEEFLTKYDVKLNNAILAEPKHLPIYEEMVKNFDVTYIAGGATQNSIRVAQWMLKTPGATGYIGCIGKDEFGRTLRESVTKDGVKVHYLEDDVTPTGTCACLIHNGERSLVANIAAANCYKIEHLKSEPVWSAVQQCKVFYSSGFFLTVSPDSMVAVGEHCAQTNKHFVFNLSAPFLIEFFSEAMARVFPYADVVFGNEVEALTFAKFHKWECAATENMEEIARRMVALPKVNNNRPRVVVITQGSKSTIVATKWYGEFVKVTNYPVEPLARELLVDTNGAGDSFVGGFLSQLVQDKSIDACVHAGHYAARIIIQNNGCSFPATCAYEPLQC